MTAHGVDRSGAASGSGAPVVVVDASVANAKGDLFAATADNIVTRLPVGANETRLVADSAQTTGLKYVPDTTNYAVAAKGDLLVGTAADTVAPITVGANDTVLTADSSQATGVKWVATTASPVGAVTCYAGLTEPSGWVFCYGQAISRATFAALFAVISTTYGVGDGSTTFNVPDLRGRVVAGQDDMGGSSADRLTNQTGGLDGDTLGASGGSETNTLTQAQTPVKSHTHGNGTLAIDSQGDHAHTETREGNPDGAGGNSVVTGVGDEGSLSPVATANSTSTNGAHSHNITGAIAAASDATATAHNNVQPTFILNYIIKT